MKSKAKINKLLHEASVTVIEHDSMNKIFQTVAKKNMVEYSEFGFRNTFPTLYASIIEAMNEAYKLGGGDDRIEQITDRIFLHKNR